VKFLVDNQLPAALARFLASRGVDCRHVLYLDLGDATDAEIWEYTCRNDCVVISKDEEFSTWRMYDPQESRFDSGSASGFAADDILWACVNSY